MGKSLENNGKIMGISWEKTWENHGSNVFFDGLDVFFYLENHGNFMENHGRFLETPGNQMWLGKSPEMKEPNRRIHQDT
jgi:hypothetical protein